MDKLPVDIIADILSRLPIKSLMRCRCVSKPWLNLTQNPRFILMHLNRSSLHPNPNLILDSSICINAMDSHTQLHFLEHFEIETHRDYTCSNVNFSQPHFKDFRVMGSCNGLLCLVQSVNGCNIYVCNPCTRNYIQIRHPINGSSWCRDEIVAGFGFCPKTDEYKVVVSGRLTGSDVYLCTLGDSVWRCVGNNPCAIWWQSCSGTFVNGALHWVGLSPDFLIVSFDIVDEVVGVIPWPEVGLGRGSDPFLGILSGCLSITAFSGEDCVEIWLMKDYGIKESWTKWFALNFNQVGLNVTFIQSLYIQEDGELLMIYNNEGLLSFNPQTMNSRKLNIVGCPPWRKAITHVGSLVSPSNCLRNTRQH